MPLVVLSKSKHPEIVDQPLGAARLLIVKAIDRRDKSTVSMFNDEELSAEHVFGPPASQWEERKHPRAQVDSGKYKPGEFVPKPEAPAPPVAPSNAVALEQLRRIAGGVTTNLYTDVNLRQDPDGVLHARFAGRHHDFMLWGYRDGRWQPEPATKESGQGWVGAETVRVKANPAPTMYGQVGEYTGRTHNDGRLTTYEIRMLEGFEVGKSYWIPQPSGGAIQMPPADVLPPRPAHALIAATALGALAKRARAYARAGSIAVLPDRDGVIRRAIVWRSGGPRMKIVYDPQDGWRSVPGTPPDWEDSVSLSGVDAMSTADFSALAKRAMVPGLDWVELPWEADMLGAGQAKRLEAQVLAAIHEVHAVRGHEVVFAFAPDGRQLFRKVGGPANSYGGYSVSIEDDGKELLLANPGSVMVHNHPVEWDLTAEHPHWGISTPSIDDLFLACQYGLAETIVVSATKVFHVKPSVELPWTKDNADRMWERLREIDTEIASGIWPRVRDNTLTTDQAEARHFQAFADAIAAQGVVSLTVEPIG